MAGSEKKAPSRATIKRAERLTRERIEDSLADAAAPLERPTKWFVERAAKSAAAIFSETAPQEEAASVLRLRVEASEAGRVVMAWAGVSALAAIALALCLVLRAPEIWVPLLSGLVGVTGITSAELTRKRLRRFPRTSTTYSTGTAGGLSPLQQLDAANADLKRAREVAVTRWLTDLINQEIGEIYGADLPELDPTGLAEIDDPEHDIPTAAATNVQKVVSRMPGGSIGVAGPRGAGKSTLLKKLTLGAHREDNERIAIAILADAPVEYDGREFILHLFAQLCEGVLGPPRVQTMRDWRSGLERLAGRRSHASVSRMPYPLGLGLALLVIGAATLISLESLESNIEPSAFVPLAVATAAIGALLLLPWILTLPLRLIEHLDILSSDSGGLIRLAESHLRQIWFQQTFTSGWSGSLKAPFGFEAGSEKGIQVAENQLSFPDIVARYKEFVSRIVKEDGQVRIGIDELDKMDDSRARRFLDEIKVIFRVSGCFYFVSVSEDAMADFERRGLPFRDVFDSSFDDVRMVGYLSYADSLKMLRRRVVGMPVQFVVLCHVLGGGLARDVIRVARDVSERPSGSNLGEVARTICARQLETKCTAARIGMRKLDNPTYVALLSRWLTSIEVATLGAETLLERCACFQVEFIAALGLPSADSAVIKEHRDALSIGLEVITFTYFVAALLEGLKGMGNKESARTAIHDGTVDELARARQAFAVSPTEAWETIATIMPLPTSPHSG